MSYQRRRKADWVHTCRVCNVETHHVDQFGAYAADWDHRKSSAHVGRQMGEAWGGVVEGFKQVGNILQSFVDQIADNLRMPTSDTSQPETSGRPDKMKGGNNA